MTTDNKTAPVDVLAVMEEDADRIDAEFGEGTGDKLRNARAAVAELIEAVTEGRNETFGRFVFDEHQANRLRAALARIKGEAA